MTETTTVYPLTVQDIVLYRVQAFNIHPHLTHAIFSRKGGVSIGPYRSLNLSTATGDDPSTVAKNLQLACQALDISTEQTAASRLVHKTEVVLVNRINRRQNMGHADGLITNTPNIFLFMRFADCTPLLCYDPVKSAVGVMHAGWRGTVQNAAGALVAAMTGAFGCQPEDMMSVIGPAIGPCCYEVGPDVITAAHTTLANAPQLFTRHHGDQAYFDLWAANRQQLAAAGVSQIVETNLCTACQTDQFFSHRAEKGQTGRFGVIIGIKEGEAA